MGPRGAPPVRAGRVVVAKNVLGGASSRNAEKRKKGQPRNRAPTTTKFDKELKNERRKASRGFLLVCFSWRLYSPMVSVATQRSSGLRRPRSRNRSTSDGAWPKNTKKTPKGAENTSSNTEKKLRKRRNAPGDIKKTHKREIEYQKTTKRQRK